MIKNIPSVGVSVASEADGECVSSWEEDSSTSKDSSKLSFSSSPVDMIYAEVEAEATGRGKGPSVEIEYKTNSNVQCLRIRKLSYQSSSLHSLICSEQHFSVASFSVFLFLPAFWECWF